MSKNVLILEDNEKTLLFVKEAIENIYGNQIKVYTAVTYQEACFLAFSVHIDAFILDIICLLYTSPSPRDFASSRMPSSA